MIGQNGNAAWMGYRLIPDGSRADAPFPNGKNGTVVGS